MSAFSDKVRAQCAVSCAHRPAFAVERAPCTVKVDITTADRGESTVAGHAAQNRWLINEAARACEACSRSNVICDITGDLMICTCDYDPNA